jgi:WD40 repeat protein
MGHPYHDGPVTCLDFHPSTEGLLLTGSEDNTARLVSGVSGKVLGTLAAHAETIECVGLSGDFPFAASGAIDAKLVVWDLNTLQPRTTLQHDKAVSALRWIPGTACLYRCGETTKSVAKIFSRFPEFFVPLGDTTFSLSPFSGRNERASLGYPCRCGGGQQFARLEPHVGRSYGAPRLSIRE